MDIEREAHEEAMRLVADGVPEHQAIEWAVDLIVKRHRRRLALGQIDVATKVKEVVSPWLWVLSALGFVMALTNTSRISKMYGSWKRGRLALKKGEPPNA